MENVVSVKLKFHTLFEAPISVNQLEQSSQRLVEHMKLMKQHVEVK